jgi:DNA-binding NarL/FixJ family response regulator
MRPLTPLQEKYMALICQGLTNAEISRSMGVFEQTVKNNVSRLPARMGAQNEAHAVFICLSRESKHGH